jgi:hypothetical protein
MDGIYSISSRGQPTSSGPPDWGLRVGLITPRRKKISFLLKFISKPRTRTQNVWFTTINSDQTPNESPCRFKYQNLAASPCDQCTVPLLINITRYFRYERSSHILIFLTKLKPDWEDMNLECWALNYIPRRVNSHASSAPSSKIPSPTLRGHTEIPRIDCVIPSDSI